MKTYTVTYEETYGGCFDIEAESEEEAEQYFWDNLDYYSGKFECFDTKLDIEENN